MIRVAALALMLIALAGGAAPAFGQLPPPDPRTSDPQIIPSEDAEKIQKATTDVDPYWDKAEAWRELRHAVVRVPLAAALAAALAFRPRRRGTPPRKAPVIQTQIILAIIGAVIMLVVGVSLARAFGIVGAAGLIRYRAKIDDPKDAGVMLSTLAIGLACGVGLYFLAMFTATFIILSLWVIESFEPAATKLFQLKVALDGAKDHEGLRANIENMLRRARLEYELRAAAPDALEYEVKVPIERKTDRLSTAIVQLQPDANLAVEWQEKKEKK